MPSRRPPRRGQGGRGSADQRTGGILPPSRATDDPGRSGTYGNAGHRDHTGDAPARFHAGVRDGGTHPATGIGMPVGYAPDPSRGGARRATRAARMASVWRGTPPLSRPRRPRRARRRTSRASTTLATRGSPGRVPRELAEARSASRSASTMAASSWRGSGAPASRRACLAARFLARSASRRDAFEAGRDGVRGMPADMGRW